MRTFLIIILSSIFFNTYSQELRSYSFEEVDSLLHTEERPIVVFLHTDWCKYCLQMENTTFKSDSIINLLNSKYYFISFNAESKKTIHYKGNEFKFIPKGNGGTHEIALELGSINGELSYPSICVINNNNIVYQYGGLMKTEELLTLLNKL